MDLTKDGVINPEEWLALVQRNPGACLGCALAAHAGHCDVHVPMQGCAGCGSQVAGCAECPKLPLLPMQGRLCHAAGFAKLCRVWHVSARAFAAVRRSQVGQRKCVPLAACAAPAQDRLLLPLLRADVISFMTLPVLTEVCKRWPTPKKAGPPPPPQPQQRVWEQ